jgi:hypothetical protein
VSGCQHATNIGTSNYFIFFIRRICQHGKHNTCNTFHFFPVHLCIHVTHTIVYSNFSFLNGEDKKLNQYLLSFASYSLDIGCGLFSRGSYYHICTCWNSFWRCHALASLSQLSSRLPIRTHCWCVPLVLLPCSFFAECFFSLLYPSSHRILFVLLSFFLPCKELHQFCCHFNTKLSEETAHELNMSIIMDSDNNGDAREKANGSGVTSIFKSNYGNNLVLCIKWMVTVCHLGKVDILVKHL